MQIGTERIAAAILTSIIAFFFFGLTVYPFQNEAPDQPDLILRLPAAVAVPAGGPNKIQRFRLGTDQSKDRWIRGFEFRPGDPRVVHSACFYVEKTGQWLGAWSPGQQLIEFPDTVAAYLPTGSNIIADINYQSIDTDAEDLSSLGLFFTDRKPLRPLTAIGVETRVEVPATGEIVRVQKELPVIADSYALGLNPEMKALGQSFEVSAIDPSGTSQVLLDVKEYKPDIQSAFTFDQPLMITSGTRIVATAFYRNDSSLVGEDLFKLTMTLYPSAEYHPVSYDAPARQIAPARTKTAKKPAAPKRPAPAKKKPVAKSKATKPQR